MSLLQHFTDATNRLSASLLNEEPYNPQQASQPSLQHEINEAGRLQSELSQAIDKANERYCYDVAMRFTEETCMLTGGIAAFISFPLMIGTTAWLGPIGIALGGITALTALTAMIAAPLSNYLVDRLGQSKTGVQQNELACSGYEQKQQYERAVLVNDLYSIVDQLRDKQFNNTYPAIVQHNVFTEANKAQGGNMLQFMKAFCHFTSEFMRSDTSQDTDPIPTFTLPGF